MRQVFPVGSAGHILSDSTTNSLAVDGRRRPEGINERLVRQKGTYLQSVLNVTRYFPLPVKETVTSWHHTLLLRHVCGKTEAHRPKLLLFFCCV